MIASNNKICSNPGCNQADKPQPLTAFHKMAGTKDGRRPNCIACAKAARAARGSKSNGSAVRPDRLAEPSNAPVDAPKDLFDPELAKELWETQLGRCGCCKAPVAKALEGVVVQLPDLPYTLACVACAVPLETVWRKPRAYVLALKHLKELGLELT